MVEYVLDQILIVLLVMFDPVMSAMTLCTGSVL